MSGQNKTKIFFLSCAICAIVLGIFATKSASRVIEATTNNNTQLETDVSVAAPQADNTALIPTPDKIINDPAVLAGFVPHKALYAIKMTSKKSGSQIVNIGGQMLYEWETGCQGWTSNHKFNLQYEYADASPMQITSDFSTYELFSGESFNFVSQRKRDGILFEELRGQADMNGAEGGKATFRMPPEVTHDLPAGSVFPVRHTLEVLRHIKEGNKFFNAVIFDGSDQDGPVEVNAFIGAEVASYIAVEAAEDAIDETLLGGKAYNIRLAFFPLINQEAVSDYEMSIVFHENGVISDMVVDYHDFSVSQKLVALEKKASSIKCEADAPSDNVK